MSSDTERLKGRRIKRELLGMCRPNENTGGDRHVHAVIGYRDHKGKM